MAMQLTEIQQSILDADGHLLVTGGPGSGKTTISILKAVQLAQQSLLPEQRVLFLSFARASVARVVEAIEKEHHVSQEIKKAIDVQTYHSFFWRILNTHGYLIGLPRKLRVLTPSDEAIELSSVRSQYPAKKLTHAQKTAKFKAVDEAREQLAFNEGRISFDYYAEFVANLLQKSERIRTLISSRYPVIILDEFQDTDAKQWQVVQELARHSCLIALADQEQRIYDWRGADPERLNQFLEVLEAASFDLKGSNHRSAGTDIALLGNEVLTGEFSQKSYKGVAFYCFETGVNRAMTCLITHIYNARKRLIEAGIKDWSIAILVPTKKMTRQVSDFLWEPLASLTPVSHTAVLDMEPAILGAEIIAHLMQPTGTEHFPEFIGLLCNYYRGKGGSTPTKTALQEAERINKALVAFMKSIQQGKVPSAVSIVAKIRVVYELAVELALTGDPDKDWLAIRGLLESGQCTRLKEVAKETRNLRILRRGSVLRQELTQDWLDNGCYLNALDITRNAFVQMHFSYDNKAEKGVVVMNMHKAKGKQFDEVIIFEGWPTMQQGKIIYNGDRIVLGNDKENINDQSRQNLRVSITRAMKRLTILTPSNDPCVIFVN